MALKDLDSVGWRFWGACSAVLYGPTFYLVWISIYEEKRGTTIPFSMALIISTFIAAFVSAGLNSILQNRANAKLEAEEREIELQKVEKKKSSKEKKGKKASKPNG